MGANLHIAILGGGCFWCTESVFLALRGVHDVKPGYSGGHLDNPSYEQVCQQNTGHIEVIKITFDPDIISFERLLQVFFATHDPTTPDRQGGDVGPQYASAVFCQNEQQRITALRVIGQVQDAIGMPVVTHVLDAAHFWPAEDHHIDYYGRNPSQGYCQVVIAPKMAKLRQHFLSMLA
ncbi:peptide-methionine (S)-S-oxide reductase MsrA [Alcaligenaceae bacterium]|nr:peptide-methionine (S)-S-oxide reductase MsrA [Alcaligenaceae bacterium]